jgi:hypothetical protein
LLERALALTPAGDSEHRRVLLRFADASSQAGRFADAGDARSGPETHPRASSSRGPGLFSKHIGALAEADQPLRAREIHTAAQKLAETPLSRNTVKDCLHKHACRPGSPIERVGHGRYRHR